MTPLRKREQLQSELLGLRQLAEITPNDPIAKPLLSQRTNDLEAKIASVSQQAQLQPETELLFGGSPVSGSEGIDVKFVSHVLDSYQDMVTNDFASRYGALRHVGRRQGESESRVFLTALPRGSVGLQISQPVVTDFITAMHVAEAMDHITELVKSAAEGDQQFGAALEVFHPRVLAPLTRFLDTLSKNEVSFRMVAPSKDIQLGGEKLREAYARVAAAKSEVTNTEVVGVFGGVLLHSWRFELQPVTGTVISGWLSEQITDDAAARIALLTNHTVIATLNVTSVSTTAGKKRPVYELVSVQAQTPELAGAEGIPTTS